MCEIPCFFVHQQSYPQQIDTRPQIGPPKKINPCLPYKKGGARPCQPRGEASPALGAGSSSLVLHSVCLIRISCWPLVLKADDVHACKAILFSSAAGLLAALFVFFLLIVFPGTQHVPSQHSCIHTLRARAAVSDKEVKKNTGDKEKSDAGMPLPL